MVDATNSVLADTLDKVAPMKTKNMSHIKVRPWMNKDIPALKESCRKAERTWMKTKPKVNHSTLNEKIVTYNKNAHTETYIFLKSSLRKVDILESSSQPLMGCDNQVSFHSEQASAQRCVEFATIRRDWVVSITSGISRRPNKLGDTLTAALLLLNVFNSISHTDLREIIAQTSSSTCALDSVPSNSLRNVNDSLAPSILKIINRNLYYCL